MHSKGTPSLDELIDKAQPALRLFIFGLFLICFLKRAHDLPLADEVDFVKPIEAWFLSGPQRVGMWHAPFYPWLLMIVTRGWGFDVAVERLIGCFTTLASAVLMYGAALLVKPRLSPRGRTLIMAFALLTPVSLGSALLLDFDNTLLMATTALFLYLLTLYRSPQHGKVSGPILALSYALGLCLMSKETTPLVYPIGILVAWWRPLGRARALAASALTLVMGCVFFLFVTKIWCDIYGLPLSGVFETDALVLNLHAANKINLSLAHRIWTKIVPLIWFGWPLALLFAARLRRMARDPALAAVAAAVGTVLFAYTFVLNQRTFHFPKYMAPVLPWAAWLIILSGDDRDKTPRLTRYSLLWLLGVLAWFLILPDPLMALYHRDVWGLLQNASIVGAPLMVWALCKSSLLTRKVASLTPPSLTVFILWISLGLCGSYCREVLLTQHSVTYWYGEQALPEARAAVTPWKQRHPDGLVIAPMKDLQWNTRDLGSVFFSKDQLSGQWRHYCESTQPVLIVTRIREESSLLHAPELEGYRNCLRAISPGKDIVVGSNVAE